MRARGKSDDYNSTSLDLTSRSKTILRAFDRLQNEPVLSAKFAKIGNAFKGEKTINVLLLGCDRREGKNDRETERIFTDLGKERGVNLSLFGPNLVFDDDDENLTSRGRSNESGEDNDENENEEEEKTKGKAARINVVERERCLFHERNREKDEIEYDVAFAFNAGVWGYDSWLESFKYVLKRYPNAPIIVSAYSMKECELDEDCVREGFGEDEIKFVWEAEGNEECAGERTGGEENGSENSAWMCFVSSRSYGE
ncbi:unnamed protein product [Bathycoccus prasinos]|jgi:hypothetical protein